MFPKKLLHNSFWLIALCMLLSACDGYGQSKAFVYKPVPADYLRDYSFVPRNKTNRDTAFDITRALPQGYVTDGSVDYTAYLQQALNSHPKVAMPNFAVMVNDAGLTLNSGQTVVFKDSSKLILKPSAPGTYEIIRIHNVENVTVYSAVILGDKTTHTGTDGQWGMGIAIRASKNITIINPKVYRCWGDGIYVGGLKNVPSQNVNIVNPLLDDNRRNGISVTSANQLSITGGVIANSNGQMPQSGIDIEPNRPTDVIDHINISDVVTYNHPKYGIVISLQQLRGRKAGETNINIKNPVDDGSGNGIAIIGRPSADDTLNGNISIVNPVYLNQGDAAIKLPLRNYGMRLHISNPVKGIKPRDFDKLKKAAQAQPGVQID
ncbi:right-handed parallel beta-helix repeat-containing protein [Mucilaginibacter celer]|uniref:Right-handed parallel beta-helix repeat-containing protein n=1 Tax=Mucilaginibacter celer TaxID=2305508 RepID=A0A494VWH0_9SPHI|nr:right-handed parallel beta-helix repeat-containing protein [Mucilaginibacter celer]AYL98431.1 right-handed parallel beta-helix repeat-containing protein [Mucilaginibacter celer]